MKNMRKFVTAAAVAALTLAAASAAEAAKLKACWVYVGPVGDFGYSYQHDQGRLAAAKELGDKVDATTFLENIPENDSERAFEQLARSGCGLVFGTSFGFMDPMLKVAKKFPNVKFEHATGYKRAPNLATYAAKFYEGRYVMGQIAGKMTKTNTIGYIVSFPIPEVISGINAFEQGLKTTNPNAKVKVVWVSTWFDPGKEADAAKGVARRRRRYSRPAYRLGRAASGGGEGRQTRLRPVLRHDEVRAQGATDGQYRQLGPLLHRASEGRVGRDLEV
jgi:basic membrane protein A